jgi:hypothetical protein
MGRGNSWGGVRASCARPRRSTRGGGGGGSSGGGGGAGKRRGKRGGQSVEARAGAVRRRVGGMFDQKVVKGAGQVGVLGRVGLEERRAEGGVAPAPRTARREQSRRRLLPHAAPLSAGVVCAPARQMAPTRPNPPRLVLAPRVCPPELGAQRLRAQRGFGRRTHGTVREDKRRELLDQPPIRLRRQHPHLPARPRRAPVTRLGGAQAAVAPRIRSRGGPSVSAVAPRIRFRGGPSVSGDGAAGSTISARPSQPKPSAGAPSASACHVCQPRGGSVLVSPEAGPLRGARIPHNGPASGRGRGAPAAPRGRGRASGGAARRRGAAQPRAAAGQRPRAAPRWAGRERAAPRGLRAPRAPPPAVPRGRSPRGPAGTCDDGM